MNFPAPDNDRGQEGWLRYRPALQEYRALAAARLGPLALPHAWQDDPVARTAAAEWERARQTICAPPAEAPRVVCKADAALPQDAHELHQAGDHLELRASNPGGLLYGIFRLIRLLQTHAAPALWPGRDAPALRHRLINHWDNIHPRSDIERGYGGRSIFHWDELPALRERYYEYARLLASVGINGVILNNVNAGEPEIGGWRLLEPEFLPRLEALAGVFRAWGVGIGISVSFASPVLCGELASDDPRDPDVIAWWAGRTRRIYERIPDFLGYLIKADSEGQPGPAKFGLSHAEGSRAIAAALAPHGGRLFWRAFVYGMRDDLDLVAQPYAQFKPLDGAFPDNVSVQIKYGPRDFQPREPLHPLLGALEKTATALELQITQEYLGHDTHAVFLPSLWEEILQTPVAAAPTLAAFLARSPEAAIAGVSNVSEAANWTGHLFAQANLYGFGRMAWNPDLRAAQIAREWGALTFDNHPRAMAVATSILLRSHRVFVGYTAPFCLGQVHGNADSWERCHFDPNPAAKNGTDLFRADATGIGLDRSPASGRGVLDQYPPALRALYADPATCPDELLLWFHHLPWDWTIRDGRRLLDALLDSYSRSAAEAAGFAELWATLRTVLAGPRFDDTLAKFTAQRDHARLWADHMTDYLTSCAAGVRAIPSDRAAWRGSVPPGR